MNSGAPLTGNGDAGTLPGFKQLLPTFKSAAPDLTKLPEPILLRLPADVLFDFDSATLKPDAGNLLGQAVAMISKYPKADVQIDGYSDSFGKTDYNSDLSRQRAAAVQAWMQQRTGTTGYKFRSQGHGSSNYVVSPKGSIEAQQPNRRVEIPDPGAKAVGRSCQMASIEGKLITETFGYDGGRQVTVYVPPDPPEAVVFAGDGQ